MAQHSDLLVSVASDSGLLATITTGASAPMAGVILTCSTRDRACGHDCPGNAGTYDRVQSALGPLRWRGRLTKQGTTRPLTLTCIGAVSA
jgi:hypothetical protein